MDWKIHAIILLVGTNVVVGYSYYDYWYDHEYPHGEKSIWADTVEFWENTFDKTYFVSIDGKSFEIKGFDVESKVINELDRWESMNYTIEKINDRYFPGTIINITNNRSYNFRITFHTYDAMVNGNDISYTKQKVIDSLVVDACHWW